MTYRSRIGLTLALAALVPLAVLGFGVRHEMTSRLRAQAAERVDALVDIVDAGIATEAGALRARVGSLAARLAGDNRFRLAMGDGGGERGWLLDWAGEAMAASGLTVLRVQDSAGRVLSSGHFRNEYGRDDPGLPEAVTRAGGHALVRLRTPEGELFALAAVDSFSVSGRRYRVVGGAPFDPARPISALRSPEIEVSLALGQTPRPTGAARITLPYYDALQGKTLDIARIVVAHDPSFRLAIARQVDRWMLAAAGLTLLLAGTLTFWLGSRVTRPLSDLAEKTRSLDLDRLDQDFASDRDDEIGALSNLLGAMTNRLRSSTSRLREAERRAATGDLARQINHDVKNGLAPIRHVLRHLTETAAKTPDQLAAVFMERRATLESSITYLEGLARNYAKLVPVLDGGPGDLGALLADIGRSAEENGVRMEIRAAAGVPLVRADAIVLRRIVENLLSNAVEAIEGGTGTVTLSSEVVPGPEPRVRLAVADTGRGMTEQELSRAFDDFHTTKATGTGLGLSVVRRLVADLGGTLKVETQPGRGSTFTVELPAA